MSEEIHTQAHEDISSRLGGLETVTALIKSDLARLEGKIYGAMAIMGVLSGVISHFMK